MLTNRQAVMAFVAGVILGFLLGIAAVNLFQLLTNPI
jgi:hypothetical protein